MKTNEQARQKAIKAAWGDLWETVKEQVNMKTGWCPPAFYNEGPVLIDLRKEHKDLKSWLDFGDNGQFWNQSHVRPKSLQGIEHNNGWTRIEPDGSNLPARHVPCVWIDKDNVRHEFERTGKTDTYLRTNFKHYRPVPPPIPDPIY